MEGGIILESRERISRFPPSLACVMLCAALTIVPIGALALSQILTVDDFFAPTWLHTLLILTPAMSAIATLFGWRRLRMNYHKEVPHRLLKGHVRPIAALFGMRRLGEMLTSSHLLKLINGLFVQRGSKALRRSWVEVRAVVGLLQGVAIAVSLAYSIILSAVLSSPMFKIHPVIQFFWLLLAIITLLLAESRFVILPFFLFLVLKLFFPTTLLGEFVPQQLFGVIFLTISPPHFCLLVVALVRRLMIGRQDIKERFFSPSLLGGLCLGILLIVVAEAPRTLTRYVISKQPEIGAPLSITPLRYVVDWGTLIRAAEGGDSHDFFSEVGLSLSNSEKGSPQLAREAISRLTGEEPSVVIDRYSRGLRVFDFPSEDEARGGQIVGEKIDGLNIVSNKLRGSIHSDAALGHFEWEMTFQNDSSIPQEVRAEISLPVDGVVSRASLWVNGVEQEAAITAKNRAEATYRRIVVGNRDPLLVSEVGPGVVFLQCFPVPPVDSPQNTMKIKIDITAPVQLNSLTEGSLSLPRLQKMNFGVSSSMSDEQRWVDANTSISAPGWIRISGTEQPLENNFRILIPYPGIELPSGSIRVPLRQDATTLRSRFSSETKNQIVEQSFRTSSVPPPPSLILVVDGSAVMKERLSLIEELIDSISSTTKLSVYFAGDNVEELVTSQTIPTDWVKSRLQERLRQQSYQGATDNGVALLAALQETRRLQGESIIPKQQPRVIWLHAQQPYLFASYEVVGNFLEKNESIEPIISIQTDYERGEIAQESVPFSRVEYRLTSSESLSLISCRLLGTHECIERDFTVKPASQISSTLGNAGLHLTYLWGAREVRRMVNEGETSEAMKLATELKIVTPVTSAIVLETERDYEESGITPPTGTGGTKPGAISGTIPTTPEPEDIALIALLVMLTGFTMLHHRRSPWANHG